MTFMLHSDVEDGGNTLTIAVQGRFDYHAHKDFRSIYKSLNPIPRKIFINLRDTDYMDSSALGMLLLLKDHTGPQGIIILTEPTPDVYKILEIVNFNQLFEIQI